MLFWPVSKLAGLRNSAFPFPGALQRIKIFPVLMNKKKGRQKKRVIRAMPKFDTKACIKAIQSYLGVPADAVMLFI
jgi:hypothetical protein